MEWIEQATGFSPDGGNGSLELAITLLVLAVVFALVVGVWRIAGVRPPRV